MSNLVFIIVLLPPLLYSIGNVLDKQLINKGGSSSPILIVTLSSSLAILVVPAILFFTDLQHPYAHEAVIMMISGIFTAISVFLYLKALESDSIFSVAPALQLTPVFSYFLGIIIFSEFISIPKILGCFFIIVGSLLLTIGIEKVGRRNDFRLKIFILTTLSSLTLAISGSLFKFFATKYDYWTVQFYEYTGLFLLGTFLLLLLPGVRNKIYSMLTFKKDKTFTVLNFTTEGVMVLGDLTLNYIVLLIPLAIAYSFNAAQPVFLLLLGFLIKNISKSIDLNLGEISKSMVIYSLIITLGAIIVAIS